METSVMIGIGGFAILLTLIMLGMPIGIGTGLVGFFGLIYLESLDYSLNVLQLVPYQLVASWAFVVFPVFTLMGMFGMYSGIGSDAYDVSKMWFGRIRGSQAMATTAGCAAFSFASGSSLACAATFTSFSLPEMKKSGYSIPFASGCIAVSGTLAAMIPPSGLMVLYTIFTDVSLGKLMMAGIIPGLLSALMYILVILVWANMAHVPIDTSGAQIPFLQKLIRTRLLAALLVIMVIILGGIYMGIFTPIEAGAVGAVSTFILALLRRGMTWTNFVDSLKGTAGTMAMVFTVLVGAFIFARFLTLSQLIQYGSTFLAGLPPLSVIVLIIIIYLILGTFFDAVAMLAITLPLFFPVIQELGYDGIWFGILCVKMVEIAWVTPPLGLNVYTVFSASKGLIPRVEDVFKGVWPFLAADAVTIILLVAFPSISLFLPDKMFGA